MATIMAMIAPMKIVPQNRGSTRTRPTNPPGRRAAPSAGSTSVPNRKSSDRNEPEEAQAFEQQRQDDAERRQDRDQRGRDQQAHHPALDRRCARGSRGRACAAGAKPAAPSASRIAASAADAARSASSASATRGASVGRLRIEARSRSRRARSRALRPGSHRAACRSGQRLAFAGLTSTAWSTSRDCTGAQTASNSNAGTSAHSAA